MRVLLVSGYTDPTGVADLEDQVGVAFLQKPFTLKSLRGQIQVLMEDTVGSPDAGMPEAN
jgi:hypothetical protein